MKITCLSEADAALILTDGGASDVLGTELRTSSKTESEEETPEEEGKIRSRWIIFTVRGCFERR